MAIARDFGLSSHAEFDCTVKALPDMFWMIAQEILRSTLGSLSAAILSAYAQPPDRLGDHTSSAAAA